MKPLKGITLSILLSFIVVYCISLVISMVNVYQVGHLVENIDKRITYEYKTFILKNEDTGDGIIMPELKTFTHYHNYYTPNWETKDTVYTIITDMESKPRKKILMSCIKDNNEAMLLMAQNKRFLFIINPFKFLKQDLLLYPDVYNCVYSEYKEKIKLQKLKTKQKQIKTPAELDEIYSTWKCD